MKSTAYIQNEKLLAEINSTLHRLPERYYAGSIGIFLPANNGDIISAMSVLAYTDMLWPGKRVIWFCNYPAADAFRYSDAVYEVRPYPWEGKEVDFNTNGMRLQHNNRLNLVKAKEFEITADLQDGYFPAPWMFEPSQRPAIEYPLISKQVFGLGGHWAWHPYLCWSDQEREIASTWLKKNTPYFKELEKYDHGWNGTYIMMETVCHSNQSAWNDNLTRITMQECQKAVGACGFIFAAESDIARFSDELTHKHSFMISVRDVFTIRQTVLLLKYCSLLVGISSGISVASCARGLDMVSGFKRHTVQYCGSRICSTAAMATGPIEVIECEKYTSGPDWDHTEAERVFKENLVKTLNDIY